MITPKKNIATTAVGKYDPRSTVIIGKYALVSANSGFSITSCHIELTITPKIRITVMKKIVKPTSTSKQSIPKTPIMPGKTEENSVDLEPQEVNLDPSKE